ncbi:MAG: hypothetical protein ACR2QL_14760 [Woeseiaceae bacterium]
MTKLLQHASQLVYFALFAAFIGYFSVAPAFQYAPGNVAIVKLAFSHATNRVVPCVRLSPEEIAALAPNMRRTESCVRERLPLTIELDIDGELVLSKQASASGLWNDGPASVYEKLALPPGEYKVGLRMRDSAREDGWDYTQEEDISLLAGRYLTITFKAENGGFRIR